MADFAPTDLDRRIWTEELDAFVPAKVFDVHTHIYRWAFNINPDKESGPYAASIGTHFPEVTKELADEVDAAMMPGREIERLAFPFPFAGKCDFEASNIYVAAEMEKAENSAALMMVHPAMTEDDILDTLRRTGAIGLKPYLVYATNGDPPEASITAAQVSSSSA